MSPLQMSKPNLPSIQFLLQEAPGPVSSEDIEIPVNTANKRQFGHRSSRSVSSLPVDLQSLSLQAPEDRTVVQTTQQEPYTGLPFSSSEKTPSWMIPNDRPPLINFSSSQHRRKTGHGRSVSEFTLPPLNTPPTITNNRISSHRRAVSANTVDFMLSPTSNNSNIRAQSYSPKEPSLSFIPQSSPPPLPSQQSQSQQINITSNHYFEETTNVNTSDTSGRYVCPYCHKKFSRPSSLRIHTYSHTGEKPFVCTEPGCGRHFSVQSNMRRHLRVHRLGRGSNNNNALETTNEED